MSGVLWVEINHCCDQEMMIQSHWKPLLFEIEFSPDFELNDLASSCIINPNRNVGEGGHWTEKKIRSLILTMLPLYSECLSAIYSQRTFGRWPDSWKLKNINFVVCKMSIRSTSQICAGD